MLNKTIELFIIISSCRTSNDTFNSTGQICKKFVREKHVKLLVTSTSPYIIFISTVRIDLPMFHE